MKTKMKQINILFIVPPFPARTYPGKTMGPDYLAGILTKEGYKVEILDLDVLGVKPLDNELSSKDYDLIGISYLSFQTDVAMEIAEKCHKILSRKRRRNPNLPNYTPIIVGGVGASWCNGIVSLYPYVDAFCIGEGFVTISEIADSVSRGAFLKDREKIRGLIYFDKQKKKVIQTPKRPLEKDIDKYFPPLRLHFYPSYNFTEIFGNKKTAQMMTQIGCPFCCVFCGESTKGPLVRKRSLNSVEKELKILMKEGYRAIYFDDSTFTYDKKRTLQIISLMKKFHKKYGVIWGFNTRVDCLDEEVLTKMKESGLVYMFAGVESLAPEVVAGMNKVIPGLNKDYPPLAKTPEDYVKRAKIVYKMMEKLGIEKTSCFLIFGGPKKIIKGGKIKMTIESFEDAKKSIDTAIFELNPKYISINIMRFIPNAIMSFAEPYAVLRGQKEPFTGGYFSSKYRKKYKVKKIGFSHPIYLAFEAASDYYPIPPHLTPEYCYTILKYLVDKVNEHNKKSKIKTKIWVDKEFEKFMPRDKNGIYHLVSFEKIKKSRRPPTLRRRYAPPCPSLMLG